MEVWIPLEHTPSPPFHSPLLSVCIDPAGPGPPLPLHGWSRSLEELQPQSGQWGADTDTHTHTHTELRLWLLFTIHHADMIFRETFRSCRYRVSQLGHDWWLSVGSRMPRMF
jgi:hypothetical protein